MSYLTTKTSFFHLLSFLTPLAFGAALLPSPRDDTPSSLPHITSVQYSGSGCPSSAPRVDQTGAWNDLAFRLNAFEVTMRQSDTTASTENCEVHVRVAGCAPGWQVAVRDVDVRGHLVLDPGGALDFFVQSYWSEAASDTITVRGTVNGAAGSRVDEVVAAHARIPDDRLRWSPCSTGAGDIGLLNVNFRTALRAASGDPSGYFGGSGTTESWGYVWRRC